MEDIKTESVYCLVVDIIKSTQRIMSYSTAVRDSFNIVLSKVLSPFIKNLNLEDSIIKFTGDGWVISISDPGKTINLSCLAVLLKNKFNSEIEKLTSIKFEQKWDLRFGLAYGNDIRIEFNGQNDFVGDSIRRATRISTLCHPNEIITDYTIYSAILREFETEQINIDRRIKEFNINKIEEDIRFIFSVKEPKISKLRNSHIMLYLFDQLGIVTETELIINRTKSEADNQDLSIEEKGNIDQTSIYLSTIGRNKDSEIIDKKLKKVGYKRPVIYWNKKINILSNYESAKSVLDEMKAAGIQPNLLTYCTLFSKDINNYTIEDVHKWYLSETYNPSSALEPLIKRVFCEKRFQDAYYLILNYPHLESARKIVTRHLALSLSMYDCFKGKDFYEKNIDYALGIAYFDIGKSNKAIKHLKSALLHAVAKKRSEHIKNLLKEIELKSHQST